MIILIIPKHFILESKHFSLSKSTTVYTLKKKRKKKKTILLITGMCCKSLWCIIYLKISAPFSITSSTWASIISVLGPWQFNAFNTSVAVAAHIEVTEKENEKKKSKLLCFFHLLIKDNTKLQCVCILYATRLFLSILKTWSNFLVNVFRCPVFIMQFKKPCFPWALGGGGGGCSCYNSCWYRTWYNRERKTTK